MPTYYFHCTNGVDFVLDQKGFDAEHEGEVRRWAARAASRLMQRLPTYRGWTSWLVSVHDEDGFLIDTVLFTECRAERPSIRARRDRASSARSRVELTAALS
jgi:hypothetical protein